jgi:hypothetical protein
MSVAISSCAALALLAPPPMRCVAPARRAFVCLQAEAADESIKRGIEQFLN